MHIAIEGMDGVGKTSQAKELARQLHGEFIAKSFHEMHDISGVYDSFVTIDKFTSNRISGVYGLRQNYFIKKFSADCVVTDRFYISNYWSRAEELSVDYFKDISDEWGIPDLMIILYARPEVLYERIRKRDSKDKDLWKPKLADKAYDLMFSFVEKMNFQALVIDNSMLTFEETTEIILYAKEWGIHKCKECYADVCRIIEPEKEVIENESGIFEIVNEELVSCRNKTEAVVIPDSVKRIQEKAFVSCGLLKKIYIPKSVRRISVFAFLNVCVEMFEVDTENPEFCSIKGAIYDKKLRTLIRVPNKADFVEIENVEIIGNCAFQGCTKIKDIKLKNALKSIGYGAFIQCDNLERIVFQGGTVEKIASGIFYGCSKLHSIELPESSAYFTEEQCLKDAKGNILFYFGTRDLQNIYCVPQSDYTYPFAFYGRLYAKNIVICQRKIGAYAFEQCDIEQVILEDGVRDIGERSFGFANVEYVKINTGRCLPEIWNDSFDKRTCFIVPLESQDRYIQSRDWQNLNIWSIIQKKKAETSCGNACLDYIAEKEGFDKNDIPSKPEFYIIELAIIMRQYFLCETELFYYNSYLMRDYYDTDKMNDEYALQCVEKYIDFHGMISEEKATIEFIKKCKERYQWVILCLRSDIIFRDDDLVGNNHFVLLDAMVERGIYAVSPGRENFYRIYLTNETLMEALSGNGQWILGMVNTTSFTNKG